MHILRPTMPKKLDYNATITERIDLTDALAVFKVRPDEPIADDPAFVPGQYMTLGLNNEQKPELGSVRRPMSIVSAPEEDGNLEFYIRWVAHPESDNPLTHLLWNTRSGDRMFLRAKGVGRFTLDHTIEDGDERLKIMVAAGTGLAPFVSMARSRVLSDPSASLSDFVVLHGASYPADLGYRDELVSLAETHGLHYLSTISRPKEAPDWSGDTGRVEDYFREDRLADLESRIGLAEGGLRPENAVVYICGLQGTIGQTIMRLNHRGFVPENRKLRRVLEISEHTVPTLFFEQYDNTPVIPVDDEDVMAKMKAQLRAALGDV
ncbi:MAG: ferredoxin--NADP reductase [Thermoanaerobaculia bacterium]|nr:ferredoxin--NADP reductase [Thermoanaerobaculia bacterium]